MQFPKRENDVKALAETVSAGLAAHVADFPAWHEIATALETDVSLDDQPQNTSLEYRVVAANAVGTSLPSNTAAVVL